MSTDSELPFQFRLIFSPASEILCVSPENPFSNATTGNGRGVVDCDRRRQSGGDQRTTTTTTGVRKGRKSGHKLRSKYRFIVEEGNRFGNR